MDACHLLLGRPWQFDRKAVHDGYRNTYTFVKDGVRLILGPSKSESSPKPTKRESNNFLSMNRFLEESEESGGSLYMLLVKETVSEKKYFY